MNNEQRTINRFLNGSALILAVVLVSLLAIVGVVFIMVARVDKISASSIAENRQLNHAVDTVIAKISQRLAWDVPDPCQHQKYYDYPDAQNTWLANLEPYVVRHPTDPNLDEYYWRQISDVTGYLRQQWGLTAIQNVNVEPVNLSTTTVVREYPEIKVDSEGNFLKPNNNLAINGVSADADGDGIADSKWIELNDMTSGKGKPIYAAIRVVDNGGMLNVNTAYMFDPNGSREVIDGNSQMQINLAGLVRSGDSVSEVDSARNPYAKTFSDYQNNIVWKLEGPVDPCYLPFDISDELDFRYRYCLSSLAHTRFKNVWNFTTGFQFKGYPVTELYDGSTNRGLHDWKQNVTNPFDPNNYRRHLLTNYNIDRVINPDGGKMVNVNKAARETDANSIYQAVRAGLQDADPNLGSADAIAAQIAVNLVDFIDDDNDIVTDINDSGGVKHYGFERPCVYISELAQNFSDPCSKFNPLDPNSLSDPNIYKSYAIELYKPYVEDHSPDPNNWRIVIFDNSGGVRGAPIYWTGWTGSDQFQVLLFKNNSAPLAIDFNDVGPGGLTPADGATRVPPNSKLIWPPAIPPITYDIFFGTDSNAVANANHSSPEFKGNQDFNNGGNIFNPGLLAASTTYFWRIDYLAGSVVIQTTGVLKFTVAEPSPQVIDPNNLRVVFIGGNRIELQRKVVRTGTFITVDTVTVPRADVCDSAWLIPDPNVKFTGHSFQRDISLHKPIRNLWDNLLTQGGNPTLGGYNSYPNPTRPDPDPRQIQAHPENKQQLNNIGLTNIGEIGMIFRKSAYYDNFPGVFTGVTEPQIRLNLADPNYQQIFKYLTVFDPNKYSDETRIKGRININTAPWFVLAQLPWVSQRKNMPSNYIPGALAQAIVAYRDKMKTVDPNGPDYTARPGGAGFGSIGELDNVFAADPNYSIDYYDQHNPGIPANNLAGFPDLTPGGTVGDGAPDDFEERDVIFSRISNLVTVRSDVYTAYILVRIGANGPQKRVIAILDRSNVRLPTDKVKVLAVQQVPEAR